MPVTREDLIREAIEWAKKGIPVFPCNGNKAPLTSHGFHDAVVDPKAVRELFDFYGDSVEMIGGRMGDGIFAVDVDLYKGQEVKTWFKERLDNGTLPETRVHETKNGGKHLIYSGEVKDCKPVPGVEIKSDGGYIILPGSEGYSVKSEGLTEAPQALIAELRAAASASRGSSLSQLEANILNGSDFHSSLAQVSAKMAAAGSDQVEIQVRMIELLEASTAARPGHDRHVRWRAVIEDRGGELSRMAQSAYRKYNDDAVQEEFSELKMLGEIEAIGHEVFYASPNEVSAEEAPIVVPDHEWPFAGMGYFAHQDHDLTEQTFNLYPVFATNETVVLFAEPKTGKTALALTTALHIACGMDLGNLKVAAAGPCLYYAMEGSRAIRLRVAAWKKSQKEQGVTLPDNIPLFVVERQASLFKEKAREEAAARLIAADRYSRKLGTELKIIYIDTLTKAMSGGDQNSVEDTASLFDIVERVRAGGVTATIVFVHHKARTGNLRGSSNIEAEPDVLLDVSKKGEVVELKIARARSIEDGHTFHFALSGVDLGETVQGHPLAGVIATPLDGHGSPTEELEEFVDVQQLGQRREAICKLGSCTVKAAVDAWFQLGLIKGRELRSVPMAPAVTSAAVQKALHEVVPEPQGAIYGDYIIRTMMEAGNLVGFTVARAVH